MISTFHLYLKDLRPRLDEAFSRQLQVLLENGTRDDFSSVMATLEGGKRIRGCLSCLTCGALGGDVRTAIPRAVAIELIHTASLIHDDFVDQDTIRRNLPATWTLQGARRAVLLGDLIFASAIAEMSRLSREDGLVISQAIAQIASGAFNEPIDPMMLIKKIGTNGSSGLMYERIIYLKTGVLFGAACRLGAVAAAADLEAKEELFRYGLRIGEAYQIADDLKEVKLHLSTRSIHSKELAALAPAFSFFMKGLEAPIVAVLKHGQSEMNDWTTDYFCEVQRLMEKEIERRLNLAASSLTMDFPDAELGRLLREAPWGLVRMFNDA